MTATTLEATPLSPARGPSVSTAAARLTYVDAFRGLLTMLMSLDHATYFLWGAAEEHAFTFWQGPFASPEMPAESVIRLLSNLAAPGFFLLLGAGMAMFAQARRKLGWSNLEIARYFVVRGIVLIGLQFLVENPLWGLRPESDWLNYVGVLFALGGAMICAAALWMLPSSLLIALGAMLVVLQEIVLRLFPAVCERLPLWLALTLVPGESQGLNVYFVVLPWLGIVLWGIVYGRGLLHDQRRTAGRGAIVGLVLFATAVVIAAVGGFGNIERAEPIGRLDMLRFVKYGPSAAFVLWNVGLSLVVLQGFAWVVERSKAIGGPLVSFGRSPLFFYVAHLALFGAVSQVAGPSGLSLSTALGIWVAGLFALRPACDLYARFKLSTKPDSLWRLL